MLLKNPPRFKIIDLLVKRGQFDLDGGKIAAHPLESLVVGTSGVSCFPTAFYLHPVQGPAWIFVFPPPTVSDCRAPGQPFSSGSDTFNRLPISIKLLSTSFSVGV
ncbi:hypothetical protein [Desulfitobacterium sp. PCE1]|uniref:hypothetical protein n=1 Tax=Desulfitobacterium sp. PCE1 TaxID=146907 RepID=UPI00036AFC13|nr:hypothetical protein [Desulfitobacterium sp. PCE1]